MTATQTQATRKAERKTGKGQSSGSMGSTLANLESTATTGTATGAEKQKPVNYSGQYLYDRFIVNNAEDRTLMDIIRAASNAVDVASFKAATTEMVKLASEVEKKAGYTKNEGPQYRTAVNYRTYMTRCFGALRFASEQLTELGYTDKTGLNQATVLARKALEIAKRNWDGTEAESDASKKLRLKTNKENAALKVIQKANPRQENEDIVAYTRRTASMVAKHLKDEAKLEVEATVETKVKELLDMGTDAAQAILDQLVIALAEKAEVQA